MADNEASLAQRKAKEVSRLDSQHEIWMKNIGYYIHPAIQEGLPLSPRVADIATGTGIYLVKLSKELHPTAQLDGFDITSRAFPPDPPTNVSFHLHDARQPFAESLQGQYDFVHIRLLFALISKADWQPIATNAIRLLKPGGAIQWTEPKSQSGGVMRGEKVIDPVNLRTLQERLNNSIDDRSLQGYPNLPVIYEKMGLSRVCQDIVASDRFSEMREASTKISLLGLTAWARRIARTTTSDSWNLEELEAVKVKCEEEIAKGAYVRFEIQVTIGFQKDV